MELLSDAVDYGDAPCFLATGIRRIFLVSPHIVRVTCVRLDRSHEGAKVWRVSGHVDCDIEQAQVMNALVREALERLSRKTPVMRVVYARGDTDLH